MPGFDDQTQVRRKGTVVGRSRRLVILVGRRNVIGELARALFNFAFIVGIGVVFVLFGYGVGLVDGMGIADQ